MKLKITQTKYTFPTLKDATEERGMIGSILKMEDAKYIVQAVNEYTVLTERVKALEEENKRLKEAAGNERKLDGSLLSDNG